MAESDSNSASSSSEDQQQNEESGIDQLEVRIRFPLPYQDEQLLKSLLTQTKKKTKWTQTMKTTRRHFSLTLEARFENRVSVDTW